MSDLRGVFGFGLVAVLTVSACGQGGNQGAAGSSQASREQAVTAGDGWFPIGPAPLSPSPIYGTNSQPTLATGRASVIAINPAKADEVFLGTAAGGFWHTRNALDADPVWSAGIDGEQGFASSAIGAIALDTATCTSAGVTCNLGTSENCGCSVMWVGTGENARRRDTHYGAGVYRFARRGGGEFFSNSFQEVANTATAFKHGNVLRILPETSDTALVLVSEGVTSNSTHSTVVVPPPSSGFGLFRISESASTVTPVPVTGAGPAIPSDLQRRTDTPQTLFAAYTALGIFRSTDNGATWCGLNSGAGTLCVGASGLTPAAGFTHVQIGVSPVDNNVIYASFGTCFNRTGFGCGPTQIFRSLDGGTTWALLAITPIEDSTATGLQAYPEYTHVLTPHPTNAAQFFFAGLVMYNCSGSSSSTSFTCRGFGSNQTHPDIHDIQAANSGNVVYAATDGGFYTSADGGTTFKSGGRNLQVAEFQSIAANGGTEEIIGGLQDNSCVDFSGQRNWSTFNSGDGGDTLIDVVNDSGTTRVVKYSTAQQTSTLQRDTTGLATAQLTLPGSAERPAFYAPLEQNPVTHDIYYGRQSLFKSTDTDAVRGDSFAAISPQLGDTTTTFPDIENKDVISAIGLAPNNPAIVYIGYYSGRAFVSTGASGCPSTSSSCWTQIAGPGVSPNIAIPAGPITTINVDPTTATKAYMTVSGVAAGPHVLRNNNATAAGWEDFSQGIPNDEPCNVIKVVPSTPGELWLGTETGLYHRTGALAWEKEGGRFPSVPVYDLAIDETHGRVVAGTHGRGAWLHTQPTLSTLEGWAMGSIWDIPITGLGFLNTGTTPVTCTVELVQQNGTVCASGSVDAMGGTAQITAPNASAGDPGGTLVTSNGGNYDGLPVFWGCFNGHCLNNTPISHCNFVLDAMGNPTTTPDPVTAVRVICPGSPVGVGQVSGAPAMTAPPQNVFQINIPSGAAPALLSAPNSVRAAAVAAGSGAFDLAVSLQAGAGITRELCHTRVAFNFSESEETVLARAADQLNADPDCIAEGATAQFIGPPIGSPEEDEFGMPPRVSVTAPTLVGSRVLVTMRVLPGEAPGVCLTAADLLSRDLGQATIMKLKPLTVAGGAAGGSVKLFERTGIGSCSQTITTTAGETAAQLASAIVAAFTTPGIPGPADCLSNTNARDLSATGDSVFAAFSDSFTLCSNDPGVGFVLGPDEIDLTFNKPPVAVCKNATISVNSQCKATVAASDIDAGSFDPDGPAPTCTPSATGPFGPGSQMITLTCVDAAGASDHCIANVNIVDTTPPVITCPVSVNTLCTGPNGATATFGTGATDNCGVTANPACSVLSGSQFPLGTRLDACTVADAAGNVASCNFNVTVSLGDSPVCCPPGTNVILGTSNTDFLNGGSGRDCILGRGGQDTINGGGGDDLISGGDGDDIISGGTGNDLLFGGTGQDRVNGDAGNDFISGGDGDDICHGGDNNDTVLGGQGQDQLFGDNDDDILVGETGDDHLEGGPGNDSLDGDGAHDVCIGGPGTDVFLVCQTQVQ